MKRMKFLRYVFVVVSLLLCGCGAKKESMKVGVLRTKDSIPLYVAETERIFEKYGIDVELIEFGSASEQAKAMEAGAIDSMMTDMIVQCLLEKAGKEVRTIRTALGVHAREGKFLVVSAPDSELHEAKGLEGARVAISEGTMMEYLVDSYCIELGINIDKVKKVNIPSLSLRYEMLMEGEGVDCAILPDPLGDDAVLNGAKCMIDDSQLKNNYSVTVIAVSKELIDKHREMTEKFTSAYDEAVDMMNVSPNDYKELIFDVANVPKDMRDMYDVEKYPKNSVPSGKDVESVVEWMRNKELIEDKYAYEEIVDTSFCNK